MRTRLLATLVAAALALPLAAAAHPGHDDATTAPDPGFRIDAPHKGKPYTHLNFKNHARDFQFAVMGDRTGANRAGIFEDAIGKLNRLQPEFVISVGDLIGGYTTDTAAVLGQWDELDGLVAKLEMPYFYVAGNHDLSNEPMVKIWEERRGRRYYHFLYHDVLFLVLNTDDPFPVQMSYDQVDYFKKVLADNPNPRWTIVFMHNPSWRLEPTPLQKASGKPYEHRFVDFDELLKGRKYTLFAGHTHNYTYARRNGGHEHIVMATTGGGSDLRGARMYGEFDHIAWVTMTDNGPKIAQLELDGIHPPDLRTEKTAGLVGRMLRAAPRGSLVDAGGETFTSGTATLRLHNPLEVPVNARVQLDAPAPLAVDPAVVDADLAPGERRRVEVAVTAPEGTRTDDITAPVGVKYTGMWDGEADEEPFEVASEFAIAVDRTRTIPKATWVVVDGKLDEWGELPLGVNTPGHPRARPTSPEDASYRWGIAHDNKHLHIAIRTRDNKLVLSPDRLPHQQDGVEVRIDARPDPERSRGRALWNYTDHALVMVAPSATPGGEPTVFVRPARLAERAVVKAVAHEDGISAEISLPTAWLDRQQNGKWEALRVNTCMHDYDRPDGRLGKHLWWRPDWRFDRNVEGAGTFVRE